MRTLLATLLAAATLLLVAAGPAAADGRRSHDRGVEVAAYNIHHGAGVDERLDLERIAREIERGGADVVGLQEVDRHWGERSAFEDQARRLAKRLRMHYAYGANLDLDPPAAGRPRRQYGTAVLSEFPIRESRNTLLPRPHGGEQRGLLEAAIDVRGVRMRFATTHLQHNNAEERLAQSQRIAELLALAPEPTVLVGDLNARPDDPELAPLWPIFLDAWELAGEGPGNTYPAEAPASRIDYVLVTPGVEVQGAEVLSSPASDHLHVTAEIEVANPRAQWTRDFDVQAHRGGFGLTTESTLPAFAKALEIGVTTLELDVQITEDGWPVVTHDRQVSANKCRDTAPAFPGDPEFPYVRDYVKDLTLAQVKTLACDKPLPEHPQQEVVADARMPLLRDVFELVGC
jgi:endonuclease/exonuclease/phosphatase family metal-dependent hydrolase